MSDLEDGYVGYVGYGRSRVTIRWPIAGVDNVYLLVRTTKGWALGESHKDHIILENRTAPIEQVLVAVKLSGKRICAYTPLAGWKVRGRKHRIQAIRSKLPFKVLGNYLGHVTSLREGV